MRNAETIEVLRDETSRTPPEAHTGPRGGRSVRNRAATNRSVGDLLGTMGVVDKAEVDAVLALQQEPRGGSEGELIELVGRKLGYILLRSAAISEADLESAIREHELTGHMLGDVLVSRGVISNAQLAGALRLQKQLPGATPGRFRLGQMLVEAGVISGGTLDECMARHRQSGKKLGETLVEAGAISQDVLVSFLSRQRRLIAAAAALAFLSMASLYSPQAASVPPSLLGIHGGLMQRASITSIRAPLSVEVTAADIAHGYVEIDQPIEIVLRTDNAEGAILAFSTDSAAIESANLRTATEVLAVGENGAHLRVRKDAPGPHSMTLALRVRLNFAEGIRPGALRWPLAVFVAPA